MKKLYLMRHSKAGQTDKHLLNDHERPLTEKGEQLIPIIADFFNKNFKDTPPQIILSSTALRAKQTAALFKKSYILVKDIPIQTFQELYITGNDEILSVIHKIDEKLNSALLISHNPGLQEFAVKFSKAGDKTKFREMRSNFPPGSFAVFEADVDDWYQININSGILLNFVSSKIFK